MGKYNSGCGGADHIVPGAKSAKSASKSGFGKAGGSVKLKSDQGKNKFRTSN